MKQKHFFFMIVILTLVACRKDFKEMKDLKEKENDISAATNICSGNNWQLDNVLPAYNGGTLKKTLVYNNKIYVFDDYPKKVMSYDGTSWDTISSQIPAGVGGNGPLIEYVGIFGFTIGNKGYIGSLGIWGNGETCGAFWEYSFTSNTWTQKACFPGTGVHAASTFSIGSKGYVVGGYQPNSTATWEYDRIYDTWTQKASLPQIGRGYAAGFSIGNKGYIVNGRTEIGDSYYNLRDLLEYNPQTDTWTNKGTSGLFPGPGRYNTCAFVIGERAYAGGGRGENGNYQDFYKYNPSTNSWSQITDVPITNYSFLGFSLNSKGYLVFDFYHNPPGMLKYNPLSCLSF